jgi:hypothetical protein
MGEFSALTILADRVTGGGQALMTFGWRTIPVAI